MFERAIEIDPNFAMAYAGAADCGSMIYNAWDANPSFLAQAEASSRKAIELDPELAEGHSALAVALTHAKRHQEAEQEFEAALRLNPKLFEAHYFYARSRLQQGKRAEAVRSFEEAARLRPDDYQTFSFMAQAHEGLSQKAEAEAAHRKALQLVEKHVELNPDDARALNLGASELALAGQRELGLQWARRSLESDPDDAMMQYNTGCFYAVQGEPEEALTCLDKAIRLGYGHREWVDNDPDWDSLRTDPRFQVLLKKL
jgi:tetratricopeptide (TPR) repeat protein